MSIWADEQGENIIREQVIFIQKNLLVPYTRKNLQNYLDLHPDNTANGGKVYSLVDTEKKATVELDKEFEILDAIGMVRDKSI